MQGLRGAGGPAYPLYDFDAGSGSPTLCLAHANGFPPQAYAPLMEALSQGERALCLPFRPFWGQAAPQALQHWQQFAEDSIAGIEQHALAPVRGIGHSLGGAVMLMAAVLRPDLFESIVLLDPVMLPRPYLQWIRLRRALSSRPTGRLEAGALRRQRHWDSAEAAYQHFRQRSLLRGCSDAVVRAYVEGITMPAAAGGVALRYSPEWEARIYRTIPANIWVYLAQLTVPCLLLIGAESNTFRGTSERLWRRMRPDLTVIRLPQQGHLFPLEAPQQVAEKIRGFWTAR